MKFQHTEFAKQLFAVVAGTLFLVASIAFVSIPTSLGCTHAKTNACTAPAIAWHLT